MAASGGGSLAGSIETPRVSYGNKRGGLAATVDRMASRVAFVDDPALLADVPTGFNVVALQPSVALTAPDDVLPLDLYLDDMELEGLGAETFERLLEACALLDGALQHSGAGVSTRWRLHQLKAVWDGLLACALGAVRHVQAFDADEALLLVRRGSLADRVLPSVLAAEGVTVRVAGAVPADRAVRSDEQGGGRLGSISTRMRHALRRRRPRILCLDYRYGVPPIAAALRARGADTLLWLPPQGRARPLSLPDISELAPLFRLSGVDLWPAASAYLREVLERDVTHDVAAFHAATATVRRDRPDAILASTFAAPEAKAAATAARAAGVPSVAARHGELAIRELPLGMYQDCDVADWILCWGEWEADLARRQAPRPVNTVVVGAPTIEREVAEMPSRSAVRAELGLGSDELIALFVPTGLSGEDWFAGRRAPTDLSYVRHQIAVATELLAVAGLHVVAKEQAVGAGPLEQWARLSDIALDVIADRPFAQVVNAADAIVLDFPSTTLVQALHGRARVYVVRHPVTAWAPGVLQHLERHGVRVAPASEIGRVLRADIESGLLGTPAVYPPDAYEPLVASGPGTAAERAAEALIRICAGDVATTIVPG